MSEHTPLKWEGTLHIGRTDPVRVERQHDGSALIYTGCCQCRLIHELWVRPDGNALLFDFRPPDPDIVKDIEGARTKADDDQIQLLLKKCDAHADLLAALESAPEPPNSYDSPAQTESAIVRYWQWHAGVRAAALGKARKA